MIAINVDAAVVPVPEIAMATGIVVVIVTDVVHAHAAAHHVHRIVVALRVIVNEIATNVACATRRRSVNMSANVVARAYPT